LNIVFVAHLKDVRRPGSDCLLLCGFAKEVSSRETPKPGEVIAAGEVKFVYHGVVQNSGEIRGYLFEPLKLGRYVFVLGRSCAWALSPQDNKNFTALRGELVNRGYEVVITDLSGNLFSS